MYFAYIYIYIYTYVHTGVSIEPDYLPHANAFGIYCYCKYCCIYNASHCMVHNLNQYMTVKEVVQNQVQNRHKKSVSKQHDYWFSHWKCTLVHHMLLHLTTTSSRKLSGQEIDVCIYQQNSICLQWKWMTPMKPYEAYLTNALLSSIYLIAG